MTSRRHGLNFIKLDGDIGCLGMYGDPPSRMLLTLPSQRCRSGNGYDGHHQA